MREIRSINDQHTFITTVGGEIAHELSNAITARGNAHLVLTGGTIGIAVLSGIPIATVDWSHVHIWWGDERFVGHDSPERNCVQAHEAFVALVEARGAHVHAMPSTDDSLSLAAAAKAYAGELELFHSAGSASPAFDITLLGMGPDAHVASLFPAHPDAQQNGVTCAVRNSPKPPPERISLTYQAINQSRQVWLLVKDPGKHDALTEVLATQNDFAVPASAVHGTERTIVWTDDATLGS